MSHSASPGRPTSLVLLGLALLVSGVGCGGGSKHTAGQSTAGAPSTAEDGGANAVCKTDDDCGGSQPYCDPTRQVCGACQTGSDCRSSQQCVVGECMRPEACSNSRDCPDPLVCSDADLCVECVSNAECPVGAKCQGNACRAECASDRDCLPAGLLCDRSAGTCVECSSSKDCSDGRPCEQGQCAAAVSGAAGSDGRGKETADAGTGSGLTPSGEGGATGAHGGNGLAGSGNPASTTGGNSAIGAGGNDPSGGTSPGSGGSGGIESGGATGGQPPVAQCGNGALEGGEACDDGAVADGDGCSAQCTVEAGYHCTQASAEGTLKLPAVFRDFRAGGDFEPVEADGIADPTLGLVGSTLDADGKPEFIADDGTAFITDAESYSQWYRDMEGVDSAFASALLLWKNDAGTYENRWGEDGQLWVQTTDQQWCGTVGEEVDGQPCTYGYQTTPCDGAELVSCVQDGSSWYGSIVSERDPGSPLFFPLDDVAGMITPLDECSAAVIPPPYGQWENDPSDKLHNFHFTSEMHLQFTFDAAGATSLSIEGDDDVWVFINGRLALDLGGIHTPASGMVTLNADGSGTSRISMTVGADVETTMGLGLQDGQSYDVAIFQAERKERSSTFLLQLRGLEVAPLQCMRR